MASSLPAIIGAFVSDGLSLIQIPGTSLTGMGLQAALERVMRRREEQAREVLLDELRRGRRTEYEAASEDEAAAVLFRYLRAAQEGAARRNLRLMAQVIRGQLESGHLVADEFLYWSETLATLTRQEISFLGLMIKVDREGDISGKPKTAFARWPDVVEGAIHQGLYSSEEDALMAATALGRFALVRIISYSVTSTGHSPQVSAGTPTDSLWRLAELCDFEAAALKDESVHG